MARAPWVSDILQRGGEGGGGRKRKWGRGTMQNEEMGKGYDVGAARWVRKQRRGKKQGRMQLLEESWINNKSEAQTNM